MLSVEVKTVVQREAVGAVPLPEARDALVLEALAVAPDPRRVVAPSRRSRLFLADPACLVLATGGQLQDEILPPAAFGTFLTSRPWKNVASSAKLDLSYPGTCATSASTGRG